MILQDIAYDFSICKVDEVSSRMLKNEYTFISNTDNELSVICQTRDVPDNASVVEDGWKCFRIAEDAAFEKYGMISFLTKIIAGNQTGVLVAATYDTDYLFVKDVKYAEVKRSLIENGCQFL